MTTAEKISEYLYGKGLPQSHVEQVMEKVRSEKDLQDITWDSPSDQYPDALLAVLIMRTEGIVLEWIDRNCPKVWFRPAFDRTQMAENEEAETSKSG